MNRALGTLRCQLETTQRIQRQGLSPAPADVEESSVEMRRDDSESVNSPMIRQLASALLKEFGGRS